MSEFKASKETKWEIVTKAAGSLDLLLWKCSSTFQLLPLLPPPCLGLETSFFVPFFLLSPDFKRQFIRYLQLQIFELSDQLERQSQSPSRTCLLDCPVAPSTSFGHPVETLQTASPSVILSSSHLVLLCPFNLFFQFLPLKLLSCLRLQELLQPFHQPVLWSHLPTLVHTFSRQSSRLSH